MTTTIAKPPVVRFHQAPAAVRAAFQLYERVAPAIGARWAERIWFRIPRGGPPAEPGFVIRAGDLQVAGEVWGDGPPVYLVHGWAGDRGQFSAFVAPLLARGHRVVAFDAPSHGGSPPGSFGAGGSSLPEFVTALTAVVARYGPAHGIVAHSLGATATAVATHGGLPVRRVAMLAPMASVTSYAHRFVAALGGGPRIRRRLIERVERRIAAPLRDFEVPDLCRAADLPPVLVVHDRTDPSIPVADGVAIAATWPGAQLQVTAGLGHRRLLRDPDVVAEVVDFIARP
jgi:pimeloyl-ACP methyl ester carboxylesterase